MPNRDRHDKSVLAEVQRLYDDIQRVAQEELLITGERDPARLGARVHERLEEMRKERNMTVAEHSFHPEHGEVLVLVGGDYLTPAEIAEARLPDFRIGEYEVDYKLIEERVLMHGDTHIADLFNHQLRAYSYSPKLDKPFEPREIGGDKTVRPTRKPHGRDWEQRNRKRRK